MTSTTQVQISPDINTVTATLSDLNLQPQNALIHVETTKYGGRGYFASVAIPSNTVVLACDSPFTSTIFRPYKKDACAYCFKVDFYKPCKVKLSGISISPICEDLLKSKKLANSSTFDKTAFAGLFFCSNDCRDSWTKLQDPFGALSLVLNLIDQTVASASKKTQQQESSSQTYVGTDISKTYIDQAWASAICSDKNNEVPPQTDHANRKKPKKPSIPNLDTAEHDNARLVAVVVVKAYLAAKVMTVTDDTTKQILSGYIDEFATFDDLQSNELQLITAFPELLSSHINVYKFLSAALDRTPLAPFLTVELFRSILGKEAGNAFGIWQVPVFIESECTGSSVYPLPSFFNHSCECNVKKLRKGRRMEFVTTRDIQPQEEMYISYGMFEDFPVEERQRSLFEQWHFKCACPKCQTQLHIV